MKTGEKIKNKNERDHLKNPPPFIAIMLKIKPSRVSVTVFCTREVITYNALMLIDENESIPRGILRS